MRICKILTALLSRTPAIAVSGMAALLFICSTGFSHPHVFVETELEVELGRDGIRGLWQHWTFDEFFSAWIIDEYDADRNGRFSPEETEKLYQEAFKNLKKYGFWTRVFKGDQEIPVTGIEDFRVNIRNDQATYSFFVPLDIALGSQPGEIFIAVFDEDFYCQLFFPPQEISFKGNTSGWKVDYSTQKMPELTYYFGFVTPIAVKIDIAPS